MPKLTFRLHRLQAIGTLLQTLKSPFAGGSDALGDGEVSRFAFATRPDACANGRGKSPCSQSVRTLLGMLKSERSRSQRGLDALEDACNLKCARSDTHLTIRTVPENICENESFWLISSDFPTLSHGFLLGFHLKPLIYDYPSLQPQI
jgi:hypothetical protein